MPVGQIILQVLSDIISVCLFLMMAYQLYLSLFGFRKATRDYKDHDPQARFLALIPAHNEEAVIGDIIRNLQEMDYPKELYDFYVIADNCTDKTAEIAESLGAKVIVTRKDAPDSPTGKPIALKKALERIGDYDKAYDLVMIFDADNLMDRNMFREVNSQYLDCGKPDLIQCYLGVKNKQGIIAWFYYSSFTLSNRFFQLAKNSKHLNCAIGGTGFAISSSYLKSRGGWTTMSLTEDFEIQVEATLSGKKILWNHNTRIYDEKPTRLIASIRQQFRWGKGHWFVALRNTRKLFSALFHKVLPFREFISLLTHMYNQSANILVLMQLAVSIPLSLMKYGKVILFSGSILSLIISIALFTYSYFFLFYTADHRDNNIPFKLSTLPLMFISYLLNMFVGLFNQLGGLLLHRHQSQWVKTEHSLHGNAAQSDASAQNTTGDDIA